MATQTDKIATESTLETTLGWLAVVLAVSLPLYRPWVTLATTSVLVLWIFGGGLGSRIQRLRNHRLTLAVLFFLALNIASLAWTSDFDAGLRYLTKYRYLLLIPMVASSVRPVYRRYAVTAFGIAAGASVLISMGVFISLYRIRNAHPGNPSPTMAHLDFGMLLALAALLVLIRVLYSNLSTGRRLSWAALALLIIVGLMINIGRAGHLAFAGGLMVLMIHWARGHSVKRVVIVSACLVLVVVLAWFALPDFRARFDDSRNELKASMIEQRYDSNLGGRIAAMKVAREVFREDPILGTGVGGNMPAFRIILDSRYADLKPSIYWYRHFHNQYAQVATELGLAGLLGLAWVFWELIRVPNRCRETDATALVLATVFLIGFLGEPFLHKQITLVMFALFAGLISAEQLDDANQQVPFDGD